MLYLGFSDNPWDLVFSLAKAESDTIAQEQQWMMKKMKMERAQ